MNRVREEVVYAMPSVVKGVSVVTVLLRPLVAFLHDLKVLLGKRQVEVLFLFFVHVVTLLLGQSGCFGCLLSREVPGDVTDTSHLKLSHYCCLDIRLHLQERLGHLVTTSNLGAYCLVNLL